MIFADRSSNANPTYDTICQGAKQGKIFLWGTVGQLESTQIEQVNEESHVNDPPQEAVVDETSHCEAREFIQNATRESVLRPPNAFGVPQDTRMPPEPQADTNDLNLMNGSLNVGTQLQGPPPFWMIVQQSLPHMPQAVQFVFSPKIDMALIFSTISGWK